MPEAPQIPAGLPLADDPAVIAEVVASPQKADPPPTEETIPRDTLPADTLQEPAPMLDVHPAHHAASSFKEFCIHIATIVLGLIIAVGLEQGVEYIHHRHELTEARKELATERKINIVRFSVETEEIHRYVAVLQNNLAIFIYLRDHPGKPVPPSLGTLRWAMMSVGMANSAWTTAQHNGVVDYMRPSEARNDAELYTRLDTLTQQIRDARAASMECWRYKVVDPDPTRLSPDQLVHEIDLVSKALFTLRNLANTMRNAHINFPDFAPAPSEQDLAAIIHGTTVRSADDQRDYEAVNREIARFQDYEKSLDQHEGTE